MSIPPSAINDRALSFLKGGGEMGEITRNYDWASSSLGTPDQWPKSLQITLGILLHSSFPMFLFWGEEFTCFYNDAYRPSLGSDGKHPATGKKGKEVWHDIWDFIGPLLQQVLATGNPVWFENQLVPFYRNGRIEDIYWTFSYSPVYDDEGKIGGVFVTCSETTRQVFALKKLEESQRQFENLVRNATVGIVVLMGENLVAEIVNNAYARIINRPVDEIKGKPIFDIIPEMGPYYESTIKNVLYTGEPVYQDDQSYFILTGSNKKEGYLNIVYQPYRDDNDNITGVMILCHDITEQVADRKRLEESEQRVRSIVESAPFPIGVYAGREMRIALLNQSIMDVWGKGNNNLIGKTYAEVLPELEAQNIFRQLDEVYTKGIPFHARNQRVDLVVDGVLQPFYFNYSFIPLYDGNGNIYGVMNTAADVTDLNLAWRKVEQSERNFRNMILQAPVAMCILLGAEHVVEIANDLMLELWGKPVDHVMHKPIFEGLPDAKEQGLEELLSHVYHTGETVKATERPVVLLRNGNYETVYQNFVYEPYKDGDGTISGVLAVTIDVTEQVIARRKIEEEVIKRTKELAETNSNLQRSNAELAQFAYIASHDLQEPVRKVSTFAQMLGKNLQQSDETTRHYLNRIQDSTTKMLALIRDVLAYSQLAGEHTQQQAVNLEEVVGTIKNDFELMIGQKQATIQYHLLPTIQANALQMSQLFGNLISNALKFAKHNEPGVINIQTEIVNKPDSAAYHVPDANKDYYHITVADNGIGFNAEYAEKIFNIFQRLHGKKEYEGTGIGLAICKKIVQNHNGSIHAESGEGSGATFHILIPKD